MPDVELLDTKGNVVHRIPEYGTGDFPTQEFPPKRPVMRIAANVYENLGKFARVSLAYGPTENTPPDLALPTRVAYLGFQRGASVLITGGEIRFGGNLYPAVQLDGPFDPIPERPFYDPQGPLLLFPTS